MRAYFHVWSDSDLVTHPTVTVYRSSVLPSRRTVWSVLIIKIRSFFLSTHCDDESISLFTKENTPALETAYLCYFNNLWTQTFSRSLPAAKLSAEVSSTPCQADQGIKRIKQLRFKKKISDLPTWFSEHRTERLQRLRVELPNICRLLFSDNLRSRRPMTKILHLVRI